jgi:hypothetical protein
VHTATAKTFLLEITPFYASFYFSGQTCSFIAVSFTSPRLSRFLRGYIFTGPIHTFFPFRDTTRFPYLFARLSHSSSLSFRFIQPGFYGEFSCGHKAPFAFDAFCGSVYFDRALSPLGKGFLSITAYHKDGKARSFFSRWVFLFVSYFLVSWISF